MLVYFSILVVILIICATPGNSESKNNIKLFFCILPIFLFMALRVDYGGDYANYEDFYNYIHSAGSLNFDTGEIAFIWLASIMPTYRMFLVVVSILFCSALFYMFKRYIPTKFWAVAFLVIFLSKSMLFGNMSGMRNSIAVSAFIFGFYYLEQGRKLSYVILMIGASFFHSSALFFLPLIFITPKKPSKIEIVILVVICLAFAFLAAILPAISPKIMKTIVNISFFSRYDPYLEVKLTPGIRGFSYLLIFFMFYRNIKMLSQSSVTERESLLIKLSLLYFMLMLAPSVGLMSRLFFYLSFPFLVGAIYVINREHKLMLKLAYLGCILFFAGIEFYVFSLEDRFSTLYLNYHSILTY